jgi:hypothetical protein
LLPVRVKERRPATTTAEPPARAMQRSTIHIEFRQAQVRIEGVDFWVDARCIGVSPRMMGRAANTQIWIAAGVTDLRRGFTGLSPLVRSKLEQNLLSGQMFVFRGR